MRWILFIFCFMLKAFYCVFYEEMKVLDICTYIFDIGFTSLTILSFLSYYQNNNVGKNIYNEHFMFIIILNILISISGSICINYINNKKETINYSLQSVILIIINSLILLFIIQSLNYD